MRPEDFPTEVRDLILPKHTGDLVYQCLGCHHDHNIDKLLYTCPECGEVLLIQDRNFQRLSETPGETWRRIFDYRKMLKIPAYKGIYRYHEFIGPVLPPEHIIYLGEGHTPVIEANPPLQEKVGMRFFFKNDGQNPSASFKDRGMASALSYINDWAIRSRTQNLLTVCASTGDTSAAAALYAAYLYPLVKSVVLLPHKKVTPQQLSQPLGSGATVFEIPGVFDDCMKVVELLSEKYPVALLNSKNAWRILGQESYAYEIAQDFEYKMEKLAVVVPIGNAGNITAVMNGFIKFFKTGIIKSLPKIIGVQSVHANPVVRYYREVDPGKREFKSVPVQPSVAQAAMIGNPVSIPRVISLEAAYNALAGEQRVYFVETTEQAIMDWHLKANRNGHIACTHGGESLAGLVAALGNGWIQSDETAVVDSTAHALKFSGFQNMYFENEIPGAYEITPNPELINKPVHIQPAPPIPVPQPGAPLSGKDLQRFVSAVSDEIATQLDLGKH